MGKKKIYTYVSEGRDKLKEKEEFKRMTRQKGR